MQNAFDTSATKAILWRMVKSGKLTLEDLDQPTQAHQLLVRDARNNPSLGPTFIVPKIANLLRDPAPVECVEPISSRDFDMAAATRAHEGQPDVDLLPRQWPPIPGQRDRSNRDHATGRVREGDDREHEMVLAALREPLPSDAGALGKPEMEPEPTPGLEPSCPW